MKIIQIDGGLGRSLCAIPAIEDTSKKDEVYVISAYPEIWFNNPNISRVYNLGREYIWEDVISKGEYFQPEPYHDFLYYTQKHHLIENFSYLINKESKFSRPNLYLNPEEDEFGRSYIADLKRISNKKVVVFQPFGASSVFKLANMMDSLHPSMKFSGNPAFDSLKDMPPIYEIIDSSYRSLSYKLALDIVDANQDIIFVNMTYHPLDRLNVVNAKLPNRQWFSIVKYCDFILGVDSCLQHISYIFNKPGIVLYGPTFIENVGYKDHFINIQREGYPKKYFPCRFGDSPKENKDALNFTKEEVQNILDKINTFKK